MMMSELFEDASADESALLCPNCGEPWLHHGPVEVWTRKREDADEVTKVTVMGRSTEVSLSGNGNPSRRRDGIAIHFWCEICAWNSRLTIAQHKGQSLVKFKALG